MSEPIAWLNTEMVIAIHDYVLELDQIGLPGISSDKSLDGTLHRVINRYEYDGVDDILYLAACYGMAIATGHTFNDANKRTAFTSMDVFLRIEPRRTGDENSYSHQFIAIEISPVKRSL